MDMETQAAADGRPRQRHAGLRSIYQACKFYELFCEAGFKGKCAIVTCYEPQPGDISKEDSGEGATERLKQYEIYRQMLADHFDEPADEAMTQGGAVRERREGEVRQRARADAAADRRRQAADWLRCPERTYLYIDKKMQDHGLFQAICRVNRLDGDDKDYGYIVDYRDLFNSLESAITDYTSGALDGYEKEDIEGLLSRPHRARPARISTTHWSRSVPSASPSSRPRTRCSTSTTSSPSSRATPTSSRPTSPSASSSTWPSPAWFAPTRNLANDMDDGRLLRRRGRRDQGGRRPLRRRARRGQARRRREHRPQAVRGRHAQLLDNYIQAKPSEVICRLRATRAWSS